MEQQPSMDSKPTKEEVEAISRTIHMHTCTNCKNHYDCIDEDCFNELLEKGQAVCAICELLVG